MTTEQNDSFEALFQAEETKAIRHLTPGQKIKATIVGLTDESAFLDVGGKSEGVMNSSELKDGEGNFKYAVGDKINVYFLRARNSEQLFTSTLGAGAATEHLEDAYRNNIPIEGFVKAEIKGGFEITLGGNVRAFCPYSQMGLRRVEDASATYLGSHMTFKISRFDENGRNIVLSARAVQEEERAAQREQLRESLHEGDTVKGVISSIRDFGAFVDIGGIDGLIPISEIGWSRVDNVAEHFTIGQEVEAVIKKLDWDKDRISLSYRETQTDPWQETVKNFSEGSNCTGTVVRLSQFGAFVNLAPGVDGLVHISKLGKGRRINHPREVLEEGQQLEVKVESIDPAEKRISLAPIDYVSPENEANNEREEYKTFVAKKKSAKPEAAMGSLGALLKAKMSEKKK